jgi:hypothetical protein
VYGTLAYFVVVELRGIYLLTDLMMLDEKVTV